MAFDAIRPAAFAQVTGVEPYTEFYHALAFPAEWRQVILDLYRHGMRNPDVIRQVPIKRLNSAIRAVAPDLVSVAEKATIDDSNPWLYTKSEYPASVVKALIVSWLHTLQPSAEAFPLVRTAAQELDLTSLSWQLMSVDLTEQSLTAGGTAVPAPHLYRLLPEVLAARIKQLAPYEFCGEEVKFRQAATEEGAELISWPPFKYETKAKDEQKARLWRYSAVIKITLQTVPFSPVPRVHLSTGIRRWVSMPLSYLENRVGVYLRTDGPWLPEARESSRFAKTYLEYNGKLHEAAWTGRGPEGILERLSPAPVPSPVKLTEDPRGWIDGRDGVTALVTYHTTMGYHGVHAGLMPSERQRLTQWAAQALDPHFRPAGDLVRSEQRRTTPRRELKKEPSIPKKDATPEQVAAATVAKEKVRADNAVLRRANLARAVKDTGVLSCHVLYQSDEVRDELFAAAERSLGLHPHRVEIAPDTRVWRAPDVEIRIKAMPLGALGGELGAGTAPRRGRQAEEAIARRRQDTKAFVSCLPDDSQVVFVELEGMKAFRNTTDPKFAIRLGCVDAGRVSQFITPKNDDENDNLSHRADAAWADGLRQIGMSFVPQHTVPGIPGELNQLAFWILRKNSSDTTKNKQFTPIAVLIRPGQDRVMGRIPGMQGWVPYPELLKRLAGLVQGSNLNSDAKQQVATAQFIRQVLYSLSGKPAAVLACAQNMRRSWKWLENGMLIRDKIQLGNLPAQDLVMYGKRLRLVRMRDGERDETPQWWAPKDDDTAGIATGLWTVPDADENNRVFYATTDKSSTHSKVQNDDTKLTPHVGAKGKLVTNQTSDAWNPALLEIAVIGCVPEDNPEDWAMYVHQQRIVRDSYRDMLKFPLALHLAELASEYALPYADEAERVADTPDDDDETV